MNSTIEVDHENGEDVAKVLMQFVNAYGFDKEGFVNEVMRSHNTLQQALFGLFLSCCKRWEEHGKQGWYDARNDYTVKKSTEIMKLVDGNAYVPCI